MKKRVVKLNQNQLRGLIREAIQGRQPGSPLWEPLTEMPKTGISKRMTGAPSDFNRIVTSLENAFREELLGMYDPGDPSMTSLGEEAWADQVEKAVNQFTNEALSEESIDRILQSLMDGEYFR